YKPLRWARVLSMAPGILFLDELTNVQRMDVLAAAYKILYDRKAGFTKFRNDVLIVAAGNKEEESAIANPLPAPLINRTIVIDCSVPKIDEWSIWMDKRYGEKWDRRVLAYLMRFSDDFIKLPETGETLANFPTPRTWSALANLLAVMHPPEEIIDGLIGTEVATRFKAFIKTEIPDIQLLIREPERFSRLPIDGQYIAVVELANFLKKKPQQNVSRAMPIIKYLAVRHREFLVLLVLSCGSLKYTVLANIIDIAPDTADVFKEVAELRDKIAKK
ncbi:hypothetical protein DRP04_12930, partial [Archaeoglobales archaeon]